MLVSVLVDRRSKIIYGSKYLPIATFVTQALPVFFVAFVS